MDNIDLGKIGITPKGDYKPQNIYERLDLVTFRGESYISRVDINTFPLTDDSRWQKITDVSALGSLTPPQTIISTVPPSGIAQEGTEWIMYTE